MNKNLVTFVVVLISFFTGVALLQWNGMTGFDFLAIIAFVFTGWYAQKFKFGKI